MVEPSPNKIRGIMDQSKELLMIINLPKGNSSTLSKTRNFVIKQDHHGRTNQHPGRIRSATAAQGGEAHIANRILIANHSTPNER